MNRETSIYLDVVRFGAAVAVYFCHAGLERFGGGPLWQFEFLGTPAVVVFFVLSGYVVAYATDKEVVSARDYFIARASRIYSVALPAILITMAFDAAGSAIRPDFYRLPAQLIDHSLQNTVSCLLFLNELWGRHVIPGSNNPYWLWATK